MRWIELVENSKNTVPFSISFPDIKRNISLINSPEHVCFLRLTKLNQIVKLKDKYHEILIDVVFL